MKALTHVELAKAYSKKTGKPILFISFRGVGGVDWVEVLKAAPYLSVVEHGQILSDGVGFIVCDSVKEMEKLFWMTVGDDGPTKTNPYNGPARVYALTCVKGQLLNENT